MKLDLDDPLWDRLYGPYGIRPVNLRLAELADNWSTEAARTLFWDDLHHQDDLYPVTFAALPWIVDQAPDDAAGKEEQRLFLSHVIHCACRPGGTGPRGTGPRGTYRGLSLTLADHQHDWLPDHARLTAADVPVLAQLEAWFAAQAPALASDCLHLLGPDLITSAYALEGFATLHGGPGVAEAAQLFASGEPEEIIWQEIGDFDESDSKVIARLYPQLAAKSPALAAFLLSYPGCSVTPEHPDQTRLF